MAEGVLTKESAYELQLIDCNCNNCGHMERDFETYNKWEAYKRWQDKLEFDKKKAKAIEEAHTANDYEAQNTLLAKAMKMQFQFDKSKLLQYGNCKKLSKNVSFIPNTCQIETQSCFEHRKFLTTKSL